MRRCEQLSHCINGLSHSRLYLKSLLQLIIPCVLKEAGFWSWIAMQGLAPLLRTPSVSGSILSRATTCHNVFCGWLIYSVRDLNQELSVLRDSRLPHFPQIPIRSLVSPRRHLVLRKLEDGRP